MPAVSAGSNPFIGQSVNLNVISLVHVRERIGNSRGPFGIVGEQQQSFTRFVQPPYRPNPRHPISQTGIDRFTTFFIGCRGDHTSRLVQHQVNSFFFLDDTAVHFDTIPIHMHGRFGILLARAVEPDTTRTNQLRSLRTGTIS